MQRYDIAIIGTGPAGVSAAITARLRDKKVLLLGNEILSEKVEKAHEIQNYPGLPMISGEDFAKALSTHLQQMEIIVTKDKVKAIYAMGSYFAIQANKNQYEASTVIVATGTDFGKAYPGEKEYLGKGVSYCATCDAPLYRGKRVAIVGFSPAEESEAEYMGQVAAETLYFPMYEQDVNLPESVRVIRELPKSVEGDKVVRRLVTDAGNYEVDGVFLLRESVAPSQLVPGLKMDGAHIEVNRKMETNLAGCFACGDIVGTPYQYVKSAGEGNVAALSAVAYLHKMNGAK